MKGCHRVLLSDNRFEGLYARQCALRAALLPTKTPPHGPASNHPFEVGATVSRIARVNKMAAARMLRPSIVVPSIAIPSWSAARLPGQRRTTTRQDKIRSLRSDSIGTQRSSLVRRWGQPHPRPNVPRTIRSRRGWELPSSLPARQRARRPGPASWPHAS